MAFRKYTQEDYDDATERISKLINISELKDLQELDRMLKKENVYDDVRSGEGTIYRQLVANWQGFIEPSEKIRQEKKLRKMTGKPALSKRKIRQKKRRIKREKGIAYFEDENRIKTRIVRNEVRQYILHKNRYHRLDDVVIYSRTYKQRDRLVFKWYTRRKRITVKSVKKQ